MKIPPNAFEIYVAMGQDRSYQALADQFDCTLRAIAYVASREKWQEKLKAIEEEARVKGEAKLVETLEQMNERHLRTMRVVQAKALEALKSMPLGSASEAIRALDLAIKHERTIRGEPSERTAVTIEDAIKREYGRWVEQADLSELTEEVEEEEDAG